MQQRSWFTSINWSQDCTNTKPAACFSPFLLCMLNLCKSNLLLKITQWVFIKLNGVYRIQYWMRWDSYKESGCKSEIILVLVNVYVQKDLFLKLSSVTEKAMSSYKCAESICSRLNMQVTVYSTKHICISYFILLPKSTQFASMLFYYLEVLQLLLRIHCSFVFLPQTGIEDKKLSISQPSFQFFDSDLQLPY